MADDRLADVHFQSSLIKTDVTAIKLIFNSIFAGIGNRLHVFDIIDKTCQYIPVLDCQRIHGLSHNAELSLMAVYGNREIAVASLHFDGRKVSLSIVNKWIVGEWIWDVKWMKNTDELMTLTANNIASVWNWKKRIANKTVKCRDKCLLFCGIICGMKWHDSIIMGGTMFKSIVIWAPSNSSEDTSSILHKLVGHKGAIFSVFYHERSKKICSSSDDRSVKLWLVNFPHENVSVVEAWKGAKITPAFTIFGHMSRVWKSCILENGQIISAGEDSQLRIWNENGSSLYAWETHQGASIRSIDICEKRSIIITGGKDGGISLWPLCANSRTVEIAFSDKLNIINVRDVPRRLLLTKFGNLLTTTNDGTLLSYSNSKWNRVHRDSRFASYCLLDISPSRFHISLASINGDVKILNESSDTATLCVIYDDRICKGKIFSIHWLSENRFVTCCTNGKIEIWNLNRRVQMCSVVKIRDHILPACKERWLTSAVEFQHGIVVGDREGSVHVYHSDVAPYQTFRRVHGRLGVSWLSRSDDDQLFSIGRDGFIRYWRVDDAEVEQLAADRLPVNWPVRVLSSPSHGLLVFGFNETNFEVWNVNERKQLFNHKCGGGHRPWDFIIDESARFVYIREKIICSVTLPSNQLVKPSYLEGFHIRDVVCVRYLSEKLIVSGAEDTTLRLSRLNTATRSFKSIAIIRSHISSVRAIACLPVDDFVLAVSAGGRAQMKVWKFSISNEQIQYSELASHMLKPSNKSRKPWINMVHTYELEPRHMDVQLERGNRSEFVVYAAGSDAFWRIYSFDLRSKSLQLMKEVEYTGYCILKLLLIHWLDQTFLVTFATDGRATFWNPVSYSVVHQESVHQSGINSCDYTMVDDRLVLVTGGDDACLCVTLFANVNGDNVEMLAQWRNSSVHEAQISGVRVLKNFIVSTGADQKVVLWRWSIGLNNVCLNLETQRRTFVADVHGLDVTPCEQHICVYGAGIEILLLNEPTTTRP